MVVSWSIGTRPNAELRWPSWLARIADAKLVRSMSRKGCSPDNAACEGFFGRLKTEMYFVQDWLSTTIEEFVTALDAYIRWYNDARIKSSLGFRGLAEYRRCLGIAA
jgi:transposase InsO family protein